MCTSQYLLELYLIPRLTVETGTETIQVDAEVAKEPERTRLYSKTVEMLPGFDNYRRKTARVTW